MQTGFNGIVNYPTKTRYTVYLPHPFTHVCSHYPWMFPPQGVYSEEYVNHPLHLESLYNDIHDAEGPRPPDTGTVTNEAILV